MKIEIVPGPQVAAPGTLVAARGGNAGEMIVQELHGRFYEQTYRGNVYSGGMGLTSISNVTYTTGTLGATVTPIAGVYNPIGSQVNLVILQVTLGLTITAATKTGGGPFAWATSITTVPVSTGANPLNRKTLQAAGSAAKDLTNTAPTGLSPNLTVRFGSALFGGSSGAYSQVDGTIAAPSNFQISSVENFDGSFIVPPGGVIALLATTTPVAHSAVSSIIWEEVPV
jgi:hypothetical protein